MDKEKVIKDAQYRKGLSIAYFNATNAAIEMVKLLYPSLTAMVSAVVAKASEPKPEEKTAKKKPKAVKKPKVEVVSINLEEEINKWRNFFLSEHLKYYAEVIAKVGVSYKVEDAVKRLQEAKSIEELRNVWLSFSEDERRDEVIIKAKNEMKSKYEEKN